MPLIEHPTNAPIADSYITPSLLLLGLIVSTIAANSIIFFTGGEARIVYSELIIIALALIATTLGILLAGRQIVHNRSHSKMYISLAAGLFLWLCADIIWASYELVFHVAAPIPSLADILWLAGYPFFAYNLIATYRLFHNRFNRRLLIISIIGNVIFISYLIMLTLNLSDFSSQEGISMFAVLIAYPLMNAILTIPALPILIRLWKERPWSIPWTFKSLSLFCIVITDSWFAIIILSGLYEQVWLSSVFFGSEYLIMAGGLLWFNKFLLMYKTHEMAAASEVANNQDHLNITNGVRHKKTHSKNHQYLQLLVAAILIGGILSYGFMTSVTTESTKYFGPIGGENTILIGALLPLTGTLSSFGESAEASLKIAVDDVNNQFANSGSITRVGLVIEDTKTDPNVAREKIMDLGSKGIRIVIGPSTSASVDAVREYADENGILIVSSSSTAPSLAIPNDNVFRFIPDDTHQADALAKRMWDEGTRVVIPMWRTDVFGNNLQSLLKEKFEKLGGKVLDGVRYDPPVGNFAASLHRINFIVWEQQLKSLTSKVNEAIKQYGADKVGVYTIAFDEIAPIMIQANRHQELKSVRWYGSDGSAQLEGLIKNVEAAEFAAKTNFLNPIYSVNASDSFKKLEERIVQQIGRVPRSYAEVTYDEFWVAVLSLKDNPVALQEDNIITLRDSFINTANSYTGVTGSTELNEAGDRKYGSYDFWGVRPLHKEDVNNNSEHSFEWTNIATDTIGVDNNH
ncbi:MAG: ABC transporter substrate-binding protein [Thermoproteota archaeon]|nr:ABC transporter substrate-binding protein [Thermoproteota archaeon]